MDIVNERLHEGHVLTAAFQVFDALRVVIDQNAGHKNARISEAIDSKFQHPAIFDGVLVD